MKRSVAVLALFATLALGACTQFALVEPQKPVTLGSAYTIEPHVAWSRTSTGPRELWTIDGPLLDSVRFFNGLVDGDSLFEPTVARTDQLPLYRKSMTPLEIRDFVFASLNRAGYEKLATDDLRVADFGGDQGFRFEHRFATEDGLRKKGFFIGAINNGRLYLIEFAAPEIYYYEKHRATVERMIGSIRPKGSST
jgi:hypothetical protein